MANNKIIPRLISQITILSPKGIRHHPNKLNANVKIGAKMKIIKLDELGIIVSFAISFNPSANACNNPKSPTTLGPRRRCIAAKTLRSNNVKKATAKIIGKIIGRHLNQSKSIIKKIIKKIINLININIKLKKN